MRIVCFFVDPHTNLKVSGHHVLARIYLIFLLVLFSPVLIPVGLGYYSYLVGRLVVGLVVYYGVCTVARLQNAYYDYIHNPIMVAYRRRILRSNITCLFAV